MKLNIQIITGFFLLLAFCAGMFFIAGFDKTNTNVVGNTTIQNSTIPGSGLSHYERMTGPIFFNATVARHSSELPVYRGIIREGESVNKRFQDTRPLENVTSPEEAPDVAKKVLEAYGGLPPDAVSNGAYTSYERVYNSTLGQYISEKPESTTITYSQKTINGLWTIGNSNRIIVELGENGEVLWVVKRWRNYTYSGEVPIISLETAIDKLEKFELINSEWHPEAGDITIDLISPGYYAKEISKNETILEPLWMFYGGNTSTGARLGFYVYARKFANFSATNTTASRSEKIYFTDTSDTSPVRWFWDFGDGVNSTLPNPVHTYDNTGNYTVKMTAWNDLGSDTITRSVTVLSTTMPDSDSVHPVSVVNTTTITRTR
jgi:PKD repeat protein